MSALIREIYRRRELLLMLAGRNLKIRYKNSTLGFFWSLLVPLIFIAIYATFAKILRFNEGNPAYLQFLIVGIVMWQFIGMCLNDSLQAINGNANLVKKTAFARIVLPLSTIVANFANFLLTVLVLAVYLLAVGMPMRGLAYLPLVLATQFALGLGLGLMVATSNVFFRDTEHVIGIFTLAWFFLTPIFYPVALQFAQIPETWPGLVFLNPMTGILSCYRAILMSNPMPEWPLPLISFAVSWLLLVCGVAVFQSQESKFADVL